ncbi:BrnT family toxin [Azospirillum sp. SYSU D00513]|uniref:BrnT family toxin n=1 Tax=Azospirillum sp. SYSU D00513 TaxID=2812561 RepID=UPI001A978153
MKIAIDPAKDAINLAKHKLPLAYGILILSDPRAVHIPDSRFDYGEERFNCFGHVGKRLYVATYHLRDETVRFISVRKANIREQRKYHHSHHQA